MRQLSLARFALVLVVALMALAPLWALTPAETSLVQVRNSYELELDQQAIDLAQTHIKKFATDPTVYEVNYWLGRCYQRLGQSDKALAAFKIVITKATSVEYNRLRAETYFQIAETYRGQGKFEEARSAYANCLTKSDDPTLAVSAQYWLAECMYQLAGTDVQGLNAALAEYRKVIAAKPEDPLAPWALYSIGDIELHLARFSDAITDLETAAKNYKLQDDLIGGVPLDLGLSYAGRAHAELATNPAAAETDASSAVATFKGIIANPKAGAGVKEQASLSLAHTYFDMKKYQEAADAYRKALDKMDPAGKSAVETRLQLAHALYNAVKYADAAVEYGQVAESKDQELSLQGLYWLGHCWYQQAHPKESTAPSPTMKTDLPKAIAAFRRFLDQAPADNTDKPRAALLIAFSYEDLANAGDADASAKAVNAFTEISRNWPNSAENLKKYPELAKITDEAERGILRLTRTMSADTLNTMIKNNALPAGAVTWNTALQIARDQFKAGNYPEALAAAQKVLNDNPTQELLCQASYLAGASNQKLKYPEKAIPYYTKVLENTTSPELRAYSQRGLTLAYLDTKDFPNALTAAQALDALPIPAGLSDEDKAREHAERLMYLAEAYVDNKLPDKAIDTYQRVVADCPKSDLAPLAMMGIGWVAETKGDHKQAADEYRQLTVKYPDDKAVSEAFFRLGVNLSAQGDYPGAIDALKNVQPTHKMAAQAAYEIAWAYRKQNKDDEANAQFEKLAGDFPKDPLAVDSLYRIGEYWLDPQKHDNQKKYDEAIKFFNRAMTKAGEVEKTASVAELYPVIAYKLGICAYYQNQYDKAANALSAATEAMAKSAPTSDNYAESLFWLAQSLEMLGGDKANTARDTYQQYLDKFPAGPLLLDAALGVGRAGLIAKNAAARADLAKALDLCYKNTNPKLAERAKNVAPEAQFYVAQSYFDAKDYSEALKQYVLVTSPTLAYEPWYSRALLQIVHCAALTGNKAAAQNALRRLLRECPNSDAAKQAPAVAAKYGLEMPTAEP